MGFLANIFGKKKDTNKAVSAKPKTAPKITPERIGELGEYKINIQLDQFPANHKHLSDIMLINPKSRSGFSQIDHVLLTPYGIFVIETKNYAGEIVGSKDQKQWVINKKYKMMNPFHQNYGHIQTIKNALQLSSNEMIFSIISFTRRAVFRIGPELRNIQSSELCVYDTELSEFISRKIKYMKLQSASVLYTDKQIEYMCNQLEAANITDKHMRENHNTGIKSNGKGPEAKCAACGNLISYKVRQYCITNPKFNGKVYCFDHQKNLQQ
jgi:hypothetical protein